ncbi:MAG: ATP-binding protein [Bacteroidota bacterium]
MIYLISLITVFFVFTTVYVYLKYRKLQSKDRSLLMAIEISREGVYFMNLDTEETELSNSYFKLLGYEPDEISFDLKTWISHVHPSDREWVTNVYEKLDGKKDTYISIEYRLKTKGGSYLWFLDRSKVVAFNESGKAVKSIGTITQIDQIKKAEKEIEEKNRQLNEALSKLKKSQAQLIEMEKMTAIGMLTSGIANELNNPLNYVKGNVHPIRNDLADLKKYVSSISDNDDSGNSVAINSLNKAYNVDELFAEIDVLLDGIETGAENSSEIVKTLKIFFTDQNSEKPVMLNLHENIDSAIRLLHGRIKSHITIHKHFGQVQHINGWPGKLNQVFTNLLLNSIEAIDPVSKGNIYITTYQENDLAHVLLEDDGAGIDELIQNKIFDPFFTTKSDSNGLGLSVVKAVVNSHNGKVNVSRQDQKTQVHISLPLSMEMPV